jgi:hypothetical protein
MQFIRKSAACKVGVISDQCESTLNSLNQLWHMKYSTFMAVNIKFMVTILMMEANPYQPDYMASQPRNP